MEEAEISAWEKYNCALYWCVIGCSNALGGPSPSPSPSPATLTVSLTLSDQVGDDADEHRLRRVHAPRQQPDRAVHLLRPHAPLEHVLGPPAGRSVA